MLKKPAGFFNIDSTLLQCCADAKTPLLKDGLMLVILVMMVGMKSSGDDLARMERIRITTWSTVTSDSSSNRHEA